MNEPEWLLKIEANNFYNKPGFECPKCRTKIPFEQPPLQLLASGALAVFQKCPSCETIIVVNMFGGTPILIEGYKTIDEAYLRVQNLGSGAKNKEPEISVNKKELRKASFWSRLFGKR